MKQEEVFDNLKNYFETRTAIKRALGLLKPGVEVGLVIGNQIDCAIFCKDGAPSVEWREAKDPSFVFHMKPETIETLVKSKSEDITEISLNLFTEIITGNIRVEVKSNIKDIFSGDHLGALKASGQKVSSFITTHGAMNMMKVFAFIDKIKNSRP